MKHLTIAVVAILVLIQIAGMFSSSNSQPPDGTFGKLLEPPRHTIENPYHNGYFYLFGLTAPALFDPARAGYETWVEESEETGRVTHADNALGADSTPLLSPTLTSAAWESAEPLDEIQKGAATLHDALAQQQLPLTRYGRLLDLPFEDWGFGRRVTPRYHDLLSAHRLYIVEGFTLGTPQGLERLRKELQFWRLVLRASKTIGTKTLAQTVIVDDLRFLSRILAKPSVDPSILSIGMQLTLPLTPSEYSLRWPIRHQLALAVKEHRAGTARSDAQNQRDKAQEEWLLQESGLPVHAFDGIEHPLSRSMIGILFQSAQGWDTYAAYYDALITASESKAKSLPSLREVTSMTPRGLIERLANPTPNEPDWDIYYRKLMETDTRLRLASLQIQLRRPSTHTAVPTRLAEVGSQYFDPFTGLPMLWSPTQHKLYSVGKDRLDDGGDSTFDISVPAITSTATALEKQPIPPPSAVRSAHR